MGQVRRKKPVKAGSAAKRVAKPVLVKAPEPQELGRHAPLQKVKHFHRLLVGILMLGFVSKVYRLEEPSTFYFDEVYHSFTAGLYLSGDPKAYDPWAKPPQGRAHEWTHPPLSKTLMALTMGVFGENSFGWRIGSTLFATAAVGLAALVALELFASQSIALLTALFLSIEGLAFALGRIGMNDSYFICFTLFTLLNYIRWKDDKSNRRFLLVGLGLGCAAATKWTALYLFGVVGLDILRDQFWLGGKKRHSPKEWAKIVGFMGLLPVAIYVASYFQMFLMGNTFSRWWSLQQQMWWYHSKLKATHSYQSVPWQWIFNLRPVWFWGGSKGDTAANIYNLGNSMILIPGLVCALFFALRERTKSWSRWFVLLAYFLFWVPWSFSPRIMLFYHYLPAVPFLCMILARYTDMGMRSPDLWARRTAYTVLGASALWFLVFYPHLTGMNVPMSFAKAVYFALPTWK